MPPHIPSLATLESDDERRLAEELRLARLRSQAAVVRAIADQVERLSREELGAQLIEEMARLGCHLLEAAASLVAPPQVEDSGVFPRWPSGLEG
jgi:hypothetical protein